MEESLSSHENTARHAESFLAETGVDLDFSQTIKELEEEMITAANNLEFEKAALLRDQIRELKRAMAGDAAEPKKDLKGYSRANYKKGRASGQRGQPRGFRV